MSREELEKFSKEELIAIILRQQALIERLSRGLAELKAQDQRSAPPPKTSANSSIPPSKSRKPNRKQRTTAQKRGPKQGHKGRSRERQDPDIIVECRPTRCTVCDSDLSQVEQKQIGISQVVEIPPIKPVVIEAHRYQAECPTCGHNQAAHYPAGLEASRVFGARIETLLSYLHQVHHLSYERLADVFEQVFGLSLSQGAIANSLKRTAQRLQPEAEAIRQAVQTSAVVGSDETGARVDGQNWWQWVFETPQASYHVIRPRRNAQVIEEVFDDHQPEVWVSDLFSAQLKNPAEDHQVCQAHQLRDLQYAIDADRCAFAYWMQRLLRRAKRLTTHRDTLPDELYQRQVQDIEQTCDILLEQEVASAVGQKMQRRFLDHRDKLFIFLYRADVPFDNNASERALRNSVVHRKVSGGFRSEWGAEAFATVTTVVETAKRRGQQVLATLQELIGPPLPVQVAFVPP